jgi:hypothetical protein
MNKIDDNQTQHQWDTLMSYIHSEIKNPRRDKLISMYNTVAEKILTAPASSHSTRHNCFPGGYVDHVNRVVKCALTLYDTWCSLGSNTSNYTREELVFAAINHDLGKIGSLTEDYYIPNDSDWHVKRGQIYKINGKLNFMKVPDRSIFLLQEHGIEFSENEYLAIKLHDGLYSKGNESYLMAGQPEFALKSDLPILLHHADHLATLIEGNLNHQPVSQPTETKIKSKLSNIGDQISNENLKSAFDDIFGIQ